MSCFCKKIGVEGETHRAILSILKLAKMLQLFDIFSNDFQETIIMLYFLSQAFYILIMDIEMLKFPFSLLAFWHWLQHKLIGTSYCCFEMQYVALTIASFRLH